MARSSFGGGGDYSSLFGSLYAQSKALQDAKQQAADQDAYDRWKNGLLSDADWIAYIAGRVDATKNDKDPGDHQHWIQLQRQYITSIADSQAEFKFANGETTIGSLISYYTDRLSRLTSDSEEYRQIKGHLNDLTDKRDSEDLSTGAQDISERINSGKATYEDLLKFYQDRIKGLRPGSDLYKQVNTEIGKVRQTITDTKVAGEFERLQYLYQTNKLSGKAYAGKLTAMAQQYKDADPQKYYQILEAAARVAKTGSGGSGGGGGSGGSGGSGRVNKSAEDQYKATDNYLETFAAAYKSGARVIPDPLDPKKQIVLTPELMQTVDTARLANFDALASVYKDAGQNSKYTTVLENKTKYIVDFVQPHNTVEASQQFGQLLGAASKQLENMANTPDPEQALKGVVSAFEAMQGWVTSEIQRDGQVVKAEDQPTGDFLTNTSDFIQQALGVLSDPNMDSRARASAIDDIITGLQSDTGANYDKGTVAAMKTYLQRAGAVSSAAFDVASGKKVIAITPDQGITLVDTRVQHTLTLDPATGQTVSVDIAVPDLPVDAGQRVQEIWIDRGGTPTKVYALVDSAPSPYKVWVASKKVTIAGRTFEKGAPIPSALLDSSAFKAAAQSGAVTKMDAFAAAGNPLGYIQVPAYDDNGTHHDAVTYYQDPQTKLWYAGKPPVASAELNADGTVKMGADGKLALTWQKYASAGGVAVPYAGANDRVMQQYYSQGMVGIDPRYNQPTAYRDGDGNFTTDPTKSVQNQPYFDPLDESVRADNRATASDTGARVAARQRAYIDAARSVKAQEVRKGEFDPSGSTPQSVTASITRMAQGLGIKINASGSPDDRAAGRVPSPDFATVKARTAQLQSAASLPKVSAKPIQGPADLPVSGDYSSGPAVANLPGFVAPKIDMAKVVANPVPATPTGTKDDERPTYGSPTGLSAAGGSYANNTTKTTGLANI